MCENGAWGVGWCLMGVGWGGFVCESGFRNRVVLVVGV